MISFTLQGSSLGRFISFYRHPDESLSDSFSSGTPSSSTLTSGRFSFNSSLYSDYSSSSSSYRSSIYSRIRTLFGVSQGEDNFSVFRGPSSGNLLTTFHPQSSQDTSVDSTSEGTSIQSEEEPINSRISWRTIRNSFLNGSSRSPASSFRSTRWNRTSADSSCQDTNSLDPDETSLSTDNDSVFIIPTARIKVQHTYFKGNKAGYDPISEKIKCDGRLVPNGAFGDPSRDQPEIMPEQDDAVDSPRIPQPITRKVTHTYFKGRTRLSSRSRPGSVLGRPLPSIPDRHSGDDSETLINKFTYPAASCSSTVNHNVKHCAQTTEERTDGTYNGQWRDVIIPSEYHEVCESSYGLSGANILVRQASHNPQAEIASGHGSDADLENRLLIGSDRLNAQSNVAASNIHHQLKLSRNTCNRSQNYNEKETLLGAAAASSENNPIYSETNKRKIMHIYFRGNNKS